LCCSLIANLVDGQLCRALDIAERIALNLIQIRVHVRANIGIGELTRPHLIRLIHARLASHGNASIVDRLIGTDIRARIIHGAQLVRREARDRLAAVGLIRLVRYLLSELVILCRGVLNPCGELDLTDLLLLAAAATHVRVPYRRKYVNSLAATAPTAAQAEPIRRNTFQPPSALFTLVRSSLTSLRVS